MHTRLFVLFAILVFAPSFALAQQSSFGLELAPESRCSDYDRALYPYRQPLELTVAFDHRSGIYDIYTGTVFTQGVDLTIEHIVSLAEAHDSGLCAASPETRQHFASDPLNLTLTPRRINSGKSGRDLAEWLPKYNRCWYVDRSLEIRRKYGLTIDELELQPQMRFSRIARVSS
ncbi:MAG: HNH endonuclease family protein [Truepera sp.]|nr:HNH endonuclease family protein [Truepera sp.]